MIPLRDENPVQTVPVVTRALLVVNIAVFLWELMLGPDLRAAYFGWGLVPERLTAALAGQTSLPAAAITLVSSMFMHGGWLHLVGNMWYLWIFGDNIEDRLGHVGFLLFYLAAGIASAVLHVAVHPWSSVPTVGASGAIAGVLGAYAALFPRTRIVTLVPIFFFFQVIALPALVVLGLWFVLQFFSGALSLGLPGGGVAWWAHIGGFLFGVFGIRLLTRGGPSRAWVQD